MQKKILLTSLIGLCSVSMANAVCTPPTTLKCDCQHPIIENGVLVCGPSYCGDKKCMPDGSCCPEANFCQVGNSKYCCAENQTCDTSTGCIEKKADIETLCANAEGGGEIITASSGTFCRSNDWMTWYEAEEWCSSIGMTMPTMKEMCPSWDGNLFSECPELSGKGDGWVWSATIDPDDSEYAFYVILSDGYVSLLPRDNHLDGSAPAFCR